MPAFSLLDEHNVLVRNTQFSARVRMAFVHIAREILAEDPNTPGNPLRASLARTWLTPSDFNSPGLTPVVASDPDVAAAAAAGYVVGQPDSAQAAVTDEQILAAVRNAWNMTAGVTSE